MGAARGGVDGGGGAGGGRAGAGRVGVNALVGAGAGVHCRSGDGEGLAKRLWCWEGRR